MIDPQTARRVLREYHASASDEEVIDDLRRFSPALAERLGVCSASAPVRRPKKKMGITRLLQGFGRSVQKRFS